MSLNIITAPELGKHVLTRFEAIKATLARVQGIKLSCAPRRKLDQTQRPGPRSRRGRADHGRSAV